MLALPANTCDKDSTAKESIMADKLIEARIREHYVSESGEWLVEKGRMKEARLLKEACETIEQLRRAKDKIERSAYIQLNENWKKGLELERREKEIAEREARFEERKASFIRDFNEWV
jgi:hypothetical protein